MRKALTLILLVGGLALMVVSYFFLTAEWGESAEKFSNPRVAFSPLIFIVGVMSVFLSAVVYEVVPERHDR